LGIGVVVGSAGRVLLVTEKGLEHLVVPGEPDLTAVAVDVTGRVWAASAGALWLHDATQAEAFTLVWKQDDWNVPFVSIFADVGRVIATAIDGAVVEGRWEPTPG
jgi:hypothetical protein